MYYNEKIKNLNVALCVIILGCALVSILNIVESVFISKMIFVGLILQQLTIAYNDYKMNKKHRMIISLITSILVMTVFIKFYI